MANQTIMPPEIIHVDGGGAPKVGWFGKDSGATWAYGDILKFGSGTGTLLKAVAGDALLVGIALSANPFVTRTDIVTYPVAIFTRDCLIAFNAWTNNAVASDTAIAQTNVGAAYDLAIAGSPHSAYFVLNLGATTDAIFLVEGLVGGTNGDFGDHYARTIVRPKVAACALAL